MAVLVLAASGVANAVVVDDPLEVPSLWFSFLPFSCRNENEEENRKIIEGKVPMKMKADNTPTVIIPFISPTPPPALPSRRYLLPWTCRPSNMSCTGCRQKRLKTKNSPTLAVKHTAPFPSPGLARARQRNKTHDRQGSLTAAGHGETGIHGREACFPVPPRSRCDPDTTHVPAGNMYHVRGRNGSIEVCSITRNGKRVKQRKKRRAKPANTRRRNQTPAPTRAVHKPIPPGRPQPSPSVSTQTQPPRPPSTTPPLPSLHGTNIRLLHPPHIPHKQTPIRPKRLTNLHHLLLPHILPLPTPLRLELGHIPPHKRRHPPLHP